MRILQGLALGGEYGGAAIYVAEHAPPAKRGFYTSFIQASVVGGFVLSILVVIACRTLISPEDFAAWGWRIPFLLSIVLLGISLWMRLKLSESPVFQAMKAAGETSANPFKESLTYPGNPKRIFVALFGITGVLTTIWYTAFFSGLSFLRGPMRVDETLVEWMLLIAGAIAMSFYLVVGKWSDRVGRKKPIIIGAAAALALLFPIFWGIGALANPGLQASAQAAPITVTGPRCEYDPFAEIQASPCGRVLQDLTALGVPYTIDNDPASGLSIGMLSKIENGNTSPSLNTLQTLSHVLSVPLTAFLRRFEEKRSAVHTKAGHGVEMERDGTRAGHQYNLLGHIGSNSSGVMVEPYLITLSETSDVFPTFQHEGIETIYMLEGAVDYRHGTEVFRLEPGDTLFFDADAPHGPEVLVRLPIRYLSIISYPQAN